MKMHTDYSLQAYNTFGLDVKARRFVAFASADELLTALEQAQKTEGPLLLVGQGSNLLFTHPFAGTVLHSTIQGVELIDETADHVQVRAGSGVVWDEFVAQCVAAGWYGLENLSLIPGLVGASAVQNIGAYGSEAKDFIEQVEAVNLQTGETRFFNHAECRYAYRSSTFKHADAGRYAITHVTYRLSKRFEPVLSYGTIGQIVAQMDGEPTAARLREAIIRIRRNKLPDPKLLGNAGSFFMNPVIDVHLFATLSAQYPDMPHYPVGQKVKIPAAWLIEKAGWKGRCLGRAGVYEKQALVLVNLGGATADEIMRLCRAICHDVLQKFNITLQPEVLFI